MNGERHESGVQDWRHAPGNGCRAPEELSREEILRALASLDEWLKANADDAYSFSARGMLYSKLGDDRRAADLTRVIELEPDNAEALKTGQRPAAIWESTAWPGKATTPFTAGARA